MRLFLAAVTVVTSFVCGALLIARLLPFADTWLKLTLAFTWLLGSVFVAWLVVGNPRETANRPRPDRTSKLALACAWLLGRICVDWLVIGDPRETANRAGPDRTAGRARMRDYLLYLVIALTIVAIIIGLAIQDTDKGIHRKFKNDWVVGIGSACIIFGYAVRAYWRFRKNWRMWAAMAALLAAFVGLVVPTLSQMDRVPLLLMTPLIAAGSLIVHATLNWVLTGQRENNGP
jgi:hypothetical protein